MSEPPEEPVEEIRIEHRDGEVRYLRGDEARAWFNWVVKSIQFTEDHGGVPPNVDWRDE